MATLRIDPLGVFNFQVTLIDNSDFSATLLNAAKEFAVASFSECTGLDAVMEILEYREGGANDFVHKLPTRATFPNLTLRRGVIPVDNDLWDWHRAFVEGRGRRRDGLIYLLNNAREPMKIWKFTRGLPVKLTGPALNAAQSAVAVEAIEISHEGLSFNV
jgi:phage tail-like protein